MSDLLTTGDPSEPFLVQLRNGPAFLLLGQDYLRQVDGRDVFLSEIARKYGPAGIPSAPQSYEILLRGSAAVDREASLAWMDELSRKLSPPDWVRTLAGFPWSGVFTSAFDSIWPRAFRNEWRDIRPLFEEKFKPIDPRNRFQLHCTFLFGSVNRTEEAETPPLNAFTLAKRRQVATSLLRRLPELVTPVGMLAIEAYAFDRDWLQQDDLWSVIDEIGPERTHIFSVSEAELTHPFVQHLIASKKLIPHRNSLATALLRAHETGKIRLYEPPIEEGVGRRLTFASGSADVPKELWTLVMRSAIILDDAIVTRPLKLSDELLYRDFRRFLASAEGRPNWEAYAHGFAFRRSFQSELESVVEERLGMKDLADEPIILHGQTGTGKTVALATLAFEFRKRERYPVLYIERKTQRPVTSDIEHFCKWAEDAGAPACLIVWDGMLDPDEYAELLRQLTGRGRKVVVVGTTYRITTDRTPDPRLIEAPAALSQEEVAQFYTFLQRFDASVARTIMKASHDQTFLVALYRLLPTVRGQLRAGVTREVGIAEESISRRVSQTPPEPAPQTVLGLALKEAGLLTGEDLLVADDEGKDGVGTVTDLTSLVMVPGRFGLSVPFEIVLRVLGKGSYSGLSRLFSGIDVFRWNEDAVGNLTIGPRNALEARLLVQGRLGGAATEIATAKRLIREIKDDQLVPIVEGRETRFALELVRAMGAQGNDSTYFAPYFDELAYTLRELREERGVRNPRLMLQEANLLREWAVGHAKAKNFSEDIGGALDTAEHVIRSAIEWVGNDKRSRMLRSVLTVELGSVLASKSRYLLDSSHDQSTGWEMYASLKEALAEARKDDPGNYYPVDVLAWATRDIIERGSLTGEQRTEAIADVLYAFQSSDPNEFRADQVERFHRRRMEFASIVGTRDIEDEAFAQLEAIGSSAGYYLRATKIAGLVRYGFDEVAPPKDSLREALTYLEEHTTATGNDVRCLNLEFDIWWLLHAGNRLFERERVALPFTDQQWRECLSLVEDLRATGDSHREVVLLFVQALALFHLGELTEAFELFREAERNSDKVRGKRRIVRSYVASTSEGRPRKVHGTVAWVSEDGLKGEVFIEELRRKVQFIPHDFGRYDIVRGESLGEFHIAFNFVGPIADPAGYYRL